jgi:hypothetical protein
MTAAMIERRLRRFLLITVGAVCLGTIAELWFAEHTESRTQLIPFVLCGLGFLSAAWVLLMPNRLSFYTLRVVMVTALGGSLYGMYQHLSNNLAFELEIRPNATRSDVWMDALKGVNPLLAPAILALVAVLAMAATYQHPALGKREDVV